MRIAFVPASELDAKKGLRAENYIPSILVDRVKKVLARGIPQHSTKINGKALKTKKTYFSRDSGYAVARLSDDSWCGTHEGQDAARIEGCVGGYNLNAFSLMVPLHELGLVTKSEAKAFCAWHKRVDAENQRECLLAKMQELADGMGYEVTKKKP